MITFKCPIILYLSLISSVFSPIQGSLPPFMK